MHIRKKSVILWAAMLALVSVGMSTVVMLTLPSASVTYSAGKLPRSVDASDRLRTRGNNDAPVQVVVYSDFQCGACAALAQNLDTLLSQSSGQVSVVYRYFPLPRHHNAVIASLAAEAAAYQGRFWEMHNLLFSRQSEWAPLADAYPVMVRYAQELKLDLHAFEKAVNDPATVQRVKANHDEAVAARLRATPAVFVNGRQLEKAWQGEILKGAIHEASKR